jgi:hypothetical protein
LTDVNIVWFLYPFILISSLCSALYGGRNLKNPRIKRFESQRYKEHRENIENKEKRKEKRKSYLRLRRKTDAKNTIVLVLTFFSSV